MAVRRGGWWTAGRWWPGVALLAVVTAACGSSGQDEYGFTASRTPCQEAVVAALESFDGLNTSPDDVDEVIDQAVASGDCGLDGGGLYDISLASLGITDPLFEAFIVEIDALMAELGLLDESSVSATQTVPTSPPVPATQSAPAIEPPTMTASFPFVHRDGFTFDFEIGLTVVAAIDPGTTSSLPPGQTAVRYAVDALVTVTNTTAAGRSSNSPNLGFTLVFDGDSVLCAEGSDYLGGNASPLDEAGRVPGLEGVNVCTIDVGGVASSVRLPAGDSETSEYVSLTEGLIHAQDEAAEEIVRELEAGARYVRFSSAMVDCPSGGAFVKAVAIAAVNGEVTANEGSCL